MIVLGVIVYVLGLLATTYFVESDDDFLFVGILAVFWPIVLPFALIFGFLYGLGMLGAYLRDITE